jgi:hypothetical protein
MSSALARVAEFFLFRSNCHEIGEHDFAGGVGEDGFQDVGVINVTSAYL